MSWHGGDGMGSEAIGCGTELYSSFQYDHVQGAPPPTATPPSHDR